MKLSANIDENRVALEWKVKVHYALLPCVRSMLWITTRERWRVTCLRCKAKGMIP